MLIIEKEKIKKKKKKQQQQQRRSQHIGDLEVNSRVFLEAHSPS